MFKSQWEIVMWLFVSWFGVVVTSSYNYTKHWLILIWVIGDLLNVPKAWWKKCILHWVHWWIMLSLFPIIHASIAGKTLLSYSVSFLATAWLCCVCAVCASDNDDAIVEPITQLTEPRCDHPQCSILEKPSPLTKSDLVQKRKTELRILKLRGLRRNLIINWPIMPAYAPILEGTYMLEVMLSTQASRSFVKQNSTERIKVMQKQILKC